MAKSDPTSELKPEVAEALLQARVLSEAAAGSMGFGSQSCRLRDRPTFQLNQRVAAPCQLNVLCSESNA